MAETLGSLCDKLTIIKLKEYHTDDSLRLKSLSNQAQQISREIDDYVLAATSGNIPLNQLEFDSNKVFKQKGNTVGEVKGNIGEIFAELAQANNALWHEQEKVYDFENVPAKQKNIVIKQLAILNLRRNKCIDGINTNLKKIITSSSLKK